MDRSSAHSRHRNDGDQFPLHRKFFATLGQLDTAISEAHPHFSRIPGIFGMQTIRARSQAWTIARPMISAVFNFILFLPALAWYLGQKEQLPPSVRYACALGLAALGTIGWFRRGQITSQFAGVRVSAHTDSAGRSEARLSRGIGGMRYLISRTVLRATCIVLVLMTLNLSSCA